MSGGFQDSLAEELANVAREDKAKVPACPPEELKLKAHYEVQPRDLELLFALMGLLERVPSTAKYGKVMRQLLSRVECVVDLP